MPRSSSRLAQGQLDEILGAAERHGRLSDRDHEVGDLRDALQLAWGRLSPAARDEVVRAYFADHDHWVDLDAG